MFDINSIVVTVLTNKKVEEIRKLEILSLIFKIFKLIMKESNKILIGERFSLL